MSAQPTTSNAAADEATQQASSADPAHPAGHSGTNGEAKAASASEAWRGLGSVIPEFLEYVNYFVSAKVDQFKVLGRNVAIFAALGVIGLIAMSAVITTAVVMLLVGLAMAIDDLTPNHLWVGPLVISVLVLGGLVAGVVFGMKWLTQTSRAALVKKYERRQKEQRIRFGQDVSGEQADPATEVAD